MQDSLCVCVSLCVSLCLCVCVSLCLSLSLIATINHSVTLSRRHYWACIKNLHSLCWYLCSDKLVSNVEESYLNNTTSYILFYSKV